MTKTPKTKTAGSPRKARKVDAAVGVAPDAGGRLRFSAAAAAQRDAWRIPWRFGTVVLTADATASRVSAECVSDLRFLRGVRNAAGASACRGGP